MKVLCHHIYEYKKGLRDLVLHTLHVKYKEEAIQKLANNNIAFIVQQVTDEKINIFFGSEKCTQVLSIFGEIGLQNFTPEQDFILGTMLGYNRILQCERYIKKNTKPYSTSSLNDVPLSVRETQVLILIAKGVKASDIAITLGITANTVVSHRKKIGMKLGINTIAGLTEYVFKHNLV